MANSVPGIYFCNHAISKIILPQRLLLFSTYRGELYLGSCTCLHMKIPFKEGTIADIMLVCRICNWTNIFFCILKDNLHMPKNISHATWNIRGKGPDYGSATNHCDGHIVMENVKIGLQDLWLIHTARDRDRDRYKGPDWEQWVLSYCTEMFTVVRDWNMNWTHYLLLCQSHSLYLSRSRAVWTSHWTFSHVQGWLMVGTLEIEVRSARASWTPVLRYFVHFFLLFCWNYISAVDVRRKTIALHVLGQWAPLIYTSAQCNHSLTWRNFALISPDTWATNLLQNFHIIYMIY